MGLQGRPVATIIIALIYISLGVASVVAGRDLTETESTLTSPQVPASIAVPRYKLHVVVHAKGHQHYRFNGSEWALFNATAVLYNLKWKAIGVHYFLETPDALGGQPTWDTLPSKRVPYSSATARQLAREVVDADSIAWVLLQATQSHGSQKYFGDVALIQRHNTEGGLPPSSTAGARAGDVRKSPYSADYAFYILL